MAIAIAAIGFVSSCTGDTTDQTQVKDSKNQSIEVTVSTKHINGFDVLTTERNVYGKNGVLLKKVTTVDTIPSLGLIREQFDTGNEDDDGNEIDTTVTHPVDYKVFVNVK